MASTLTFDPASFRVQFPEFANATTYPDATLQAFWDNAIIYVSPINQGRLTDDSRQRAINAMTAHLCKLNSLILAGQVPQVITNSHVGEISIGLQPPTNKNHWQWWLSTTPYGMQLSALLFVRSVGGFVIGGLPENHAFRKVGGVF